MGPTMEAQPLRVSPRSEEGGAAAVARRQWARRRWGLRRWSRQRWGLRSPPFTCAPGTDLVLLIAYMCPYSLKINISSFFVCTSGKETVEDLKISRGQLAPCHVNRIKRLKTVSFAGCKVLVPNAGFLLASMPSYCPFRPIECRYL